MLETLRFISTFMHLAGQRTKSPREMAAIQEKRFRELLAFAIQHSAFYRKSFHGIDLGRCQAADLPTLNKRDMMAHFEEIVTDPAIKLADLQRFIDDPANLGKYYLGKYAVCHTSGSQGQPAVVVQDRQAMATAFAAQVARGNAVPKNCFNLLKGLFWRSRLAVVTLRRGFYPSGAAFEYMPPAMYVFTDVLRLSQSDGMEQVVRQLNRFRPHYLSAYASVLEMLAREEKAGRLRLREAGCLRQVTNMSEPLPVSSREIIQGVFGVPVVDNYAMAECMALSNGCLSHPGSHINMDLAMFEVVDENNRAVPPGVTGSKVLITNLYNRVQPLIRYEIGDVLTLGAEPCPCGSNLPVIRSIQGRTKDKFWIRDGTGYREVLPYVFMAPLLHCLDLGEYQIVQTARNAFLVRLAPLNTDQLDLERVQRVLKQGMEHEGLADLVHLNFEVVAAIRPDLRSGKVKRMLSQVGPPPEKVGLEADMPAHRAA